MEELKRRIAREKDKAAKGAGGALADAAAVAMTAAGLPPAPDGSFPMARYDAISSLVLDAEDASYTLSVEIPAPIDSLVLQASMPLDLVDAASQAPEAAGSSGGGASGGAGASSSSTASRVGTTASADGGGIAGDGATGPARGSSAASASASSVVFSTTGLLSAFRSSARFLLGFPVTPGDSADSGASINTLLSPPSRSTSAIISKTPSEGRTGVATMATYRCQEASNRVQIHLRTIEGQHGQIQALVINANLPKSATLLRLPIKPLSLHQRLAESNEAVLAGLDVAWQGVHKLFSELIASAPRVPERAVATPLHLPPSFPLGTLTVTGSFTLSHMHDWVSQCIPDVPLRLTAEGRDELSLAFRNVFIGTHLLCAYKKGFAVFQSDNPSALAIIKEVITSNATVLKASVSIAVDIPPHLLRHVMSLLHPKLHYMLTLQSKVELIDAVREMVTTDGGSDTSFLHPEFQDILTNADRYQRQLTQRGRLLEYCFGVATDAFVDTHKFHGLDVAASIPHLAELLKEYHNNPAAALAFMDRPT